MFPHREDKGIANAWDNRTLRLSHQLSIAMEDGKKRILRKHSDDVMPFRVSFNKVQNDVEEENEDS